MNGVKNTGIILGLALAVSLISAALTAVLMAGQYNRTQFEQLGGICRGIASQYPEAEQTVLEVLKAYKSNPADGSMEQWMQAGADYLMSYGYRQKDFLSPSQKASVGMAAAGFFSGGLLFISAFWLRRRKENQRIKALTDYLEEINTGGSGLLLTAADDDFSRLQDEICKTVTYAFQTRDAAVKARQKFAENLSNIAHQLKTPITAMSLSAQMMTVQKENPAFVQAHTAQIQKQLKRLTHLEEALLLLSRLDSGTLPLEQRELDVFTVLTLAADNLQEVFHSTGISVDIPELGEIRIKADPEWTMEAVMNLMKNCMEHSPEGGTVHCTYERNLLYTEILIWDEGDGFAKEDIPHLFERFYRGKRAGEGGIGIGLSIAKEILERENGAVSARNLPEGGACFEIRIYEA